MFSISFKRQQVTCQLSPPPPQSMCLQHNNPASLSRVLPRLRARCDLTPTSGCRFIKQKAFGSLQGYQAKALRRRDAQKILVPIDYSKDCRQASQWDARLAAKYRATFSLRLVAHSGWRRYARGSGRSNEGAKILAFGASVGQERSAPRRWGGRRADTRLPSGANPRRPGCRLRRHGTTGRRWPDRL